MRRVTRGCEKKGAGSGLRRGIRLRRRSQNAGNLSVDEITYYEPLRSLLFQRPPGPCQTALFNNETRVSASSPLRSLPRGNPRYVAKVPVLDFGLTFRFRRELLFETSWCNVRSIGKIRGSTRDRDGEENPRRGKPRDNGAKVKNGGEAGTRCSVS